jgi:hypothetical protein
MEQGKSPVGEVRSTLSSGDTPSLTEKDGRCANLGYGEENDVDLSELMASEESDLVIG